MALSVEQQVKPQAASRRPHIYELDPLRAVTALCVIGVHVVAFTAFLNQSVWGNEVQNGIVVALHYTREMFLFVSGLALAYVYFGKPFKFFSFWKKRGLGVVIPYCIWSGIYVVINNPGLPFRRYISTTFFAILKGSASYQLYYILLSIQFYILLPLFLLFLKVARRYPWRTLTVSFIIQVVMLYLDYHYLQTGIIPSTGFWAFVNQYQESFVLTYQFYFIMGGLVAIYMQQVRDFVLRHCWWIAAFFAASIVWLWVHFYIQLNVYNEQMVFASSVLQPIMALYSPASILFLYWIAARWASKVDATGRPKWYKFWHSLSDASFGVYLIHVLFLTVLLRWFLPVLPSILPVALRVFLIWFLTASAAVCSTIILLNIPVVSRLVGRSYSPEGINMLKGWLKRLFVHSPEVRQAQEVRTGQGSRDAQHI
jgi:peptidoglycan/LPS O-acetylase OafA/YrhL